MATAQARDPEAAATPAHDGAGSLNEPLAGVRRGIVRGGAWYAVAWLVTNVCGALNTILLVRSMSHSQYGVFVMAASTMAIICSVASFGLSQVLVQLSPRVGGDGAQVVVRYALLVSVVIATGVAATGHREILGIDVGDSENETFWREFLRKLRARGREGVRLVISDQHTGLVAAIKRCFQGASHQRCRVHFARNLLAKIPKGHQEMVAAAFRTIFAQVPTRSFFAFSMKAISGISRSTPGSSSPAKARPMSTISHLR